MVDALGGENSLYSQGEIGYEFIGDESNRGSRGIVMVGEVIGDCADDSGMILVRSGFFK